MLRTRSWNFSVAVARYIADITCHDEVTWSWKSFAPARLRFYRRKSVSPHQRILSLILSLLILASPFFSRQLKERKISRQFICPAPMVLSFSHCYPRKWLLPAPTQLRSFRYARLPLVLGTLYTIQCNGSFSVGLKFGIIFARFTFYREVKFEYWRKIASSRE